MRVFIAGGSGLIGRHLAKIPAGCGPPPGDPVPARRRRAARSRDVGLQGDPGRSHRRRGDGKKQVDGCDAVVNLAGHGIFTERWNAEVKRKIRDSRVHSAENLVTAIKNAQSRPKVFVQGPPSATTARRAMKSSPSRARPATTSSRSSAGNARTSRARSSRSEFAGPSSGRASCWRRGPVLSRS